MTTAEKKYYTGRISALRNALDELLGELETQQEQPATRSRRNLKKERIERHEQNYAIGKWGNTAKRKAS